MNRVFGSVAAALLAVLTVSADRADDVVVDEVRGKVPAAPVFAAVDLGQMFDSQAFAGGNGFGMQVIMDDGAQGGMAGKPADNDALVARQLEPVRQRLESRIQTVDRIVGLAEKQRKKLEIAAQSDLRRLTDAVAEVRAKYVGRTLKVDPRNGGFDEPARQVMQDVQQDAARCRELIAQAAGAGSLVAKVTTGTLDDQQAMKYTAVMDGRRDCRWRAAVAAVLAQFDDTLGLTQKQHDDLTAALLAAPPSADELAGDGPASAAAPVVLVATRLAAAMGGESELAAVLDPRQRAVVAEGLQQAGLWQVDAVGAGVGEFDIIVD